MNIYNKKTQKKLITVIAIILVASMILPLIVAAL